MEEIKFKMMQNTYRKEEINKEKILPQIKSVEKIFNQETKKYTPLFKNCL